MCSCFCIVILGIVLPRNITRPIHVHLREYKIQIGLGVICIEHYDVVVVLVMYGRTRATILMKFNLKRATRKIESLYRTYRKN